MSTLVLTRSIPKFIHNNVKYERKRLKIAGQYAIHAYVSTWNLIKPSNWEISDHDFENSIFN